MSHLHTKDEVWSWGGLNNMRKYQCNFCKDKVCTGECEEDKPREKKHGKEKKKIKAKRF
jgi:hypothetical protein